MAWNYKEEALKMGIRIKEFIKIPPQSVDFAAERACLECVLLNEKALHEILSVLGENDAVFYSPYNRAVFNAYLALADEARPIDVIMLLEQLRKTEQPEPPDGWGIYVTGWAGIVPTSVNAKHYAQMVLEKYRIREGINAVKLVAHSQSPADDLMPLAEKIVELHKFEQTKNIVKIGDAAREAVENMQAVVSDNVKDIVPTGYKYLDKLLRGGLRPSELMVVAARPSHGKTALALNLAYFISLRLPVLMFSLEMSPTAITERLIAICGDVLTTRIYERFQWSSEIEKSRVAAKRISSLPISIYGGTDTDIATITHQSVTFSNRNPDCVIIVDYLQLVQSKTRFSNREAEVAHISRQMKRITRETGRPVIVCCQLNRESESQSNHFKKLAYLRESGSIEQDADVVLVLCRPTQDEINEFRTKHPRYAERAENGLIACVAKNRNGAVGLSMLHFEKETQRIEQFDDLREEPATDEEPIPF